MKHLHFFSDQLDQFTILAEQYNYYLVLLSYVAACLAGFCASSVYQYMSIRPVNTKTRLLTFYSGLTLGLGIWSMHFIGMLAFSLDIEIRYDIPITILSILPAIIGSTITLFTIKQKQNKPLTLFLASGILAISIATMHFIGMEAMIMNAHMAHELWYFILAIVASWALAYLTILAIKNQLPIKALSAYPMMYSIIASISFGFSVATMHYLAMFSTFFIKTDETILNRGVPIDLLAVAALIGVLILVVGLATILTFKRRIYILDSLALAHQTYMAETIDNMSDPFILSDANGKILLVNHSFLENFSNLPFTVNKDLTINQVLKAFINDYAQCNSMQDKAELTSQIEHLQPTKFSNVSGQWWLLRQSLTDSNNRILTWTDVTQQTKQQEELIQAKDNAFNALQELQTTQSELSEAKRLNTLAKLVANVAHELNTPLGVAITSLSGLQGNVNEIETLIKTQKLSKSALYALLSSIMDYEELANRNMHRAASIIQQFKYISVEEFTENKNTIPLYQLISNNIAQLKDDLAEKQITVNFDVCDQLELHSFEDALGQVIKTLLKNAIQHAFEDSDSGQITVTAEQKNQHIEISVSDQGSGIDESVVEHIFEPFISTKRFEGSMGLGLHIVYNIVNYKLKGQINLDPKVKSGSTFIITLPLAI